MISFLRWIILDTQLIGVEMAQKRLWYACGHFTRGPSQFSLGEEIYEKGEWGKWLFWKTSWSEILRFSQTKKISTKETFFVDFFRNERGRIKLTFFNGLSHMNQGTFFVVFLVSLAGSAEKSYEKSWFAQLKKQWREKILFSATEVAEERNDKGFLPCPFFQIKSRPFRSHKRSRKRLPFSAAFFEDLFIQRKVAWPSCPPIVPTETV